MKSSALVDYNVIGCTLNNFLAAANKAALMGNGVCEVFVSVDGDMTKRKIASVSVYDNPMTLTTEVVLRLK